VKRGSAAAAVLVLALLAYAASPLIGAARLVQAARSGDLPGVEARVNLPKLKRSLARQLVVEAVSQRGLQGVERQLALTAGTAAVVAWLDELLTPSNVGALLTGRAVAQPAQQGPIDLSLLRLAPPGSMFEIWRRSGFTGLMSYELAFERPGQQGDIRLGLELQGVTWRAATIALPPDLAAELARRATAVVLRAPQP